MPLSYASDVDCSVVIACKRPSLLQNRAENARASVGTDSIRLESMRSERAENWAGQPFGLRVDAEAQKNSFLIDSALTKVDVPGAAVFCRFTDRRFDAADRGHGRSYRRGLSRAALRSSRLLTSTKIGVDVSRDCSVLIARRWTFQPPPSRGILANSSFNFRRLLIRRSFLFRCMYRVTIRWRACARCWNAAEVVSCRDGQHVAGQFSHGLCSWTCP